MKSKPIGSTLTAGALGELMGVGMRYAAKRDANEGPLIATAKSLGALAWALDEPTDWLIGWRGQWIPTEIKNPVQEGHADEYTPNQLRFRIKAKEHGLPIWIWRTEADVLASLGARRSA